MISFLSLLLLCLSSITVSAQGEAFITLDSLGGAPYATTFDNRSFFINGKRTLFLSAGIHYTRFTPQVWVDLFTKAKADGMNMIQTYVFWNAHMHKENNGIDWLGNTGGVSGSNNLTQFILLAQQFGLFVNLRIGPYVCAEFNFGGYPYWLTKVPGLVARSSAPAWEETMGSWFNATVDHFKSLKLFANDGGPIAMAQVENELHTGDQAYVTWCGNLAAAQNLPIAWLMCNGNSAPQTINSCNGGDCTGFIESYGQNGEVLKTQPAAWTEKWSPWYQKWSDGSSALPAYDSVTARGAAVGQIMTVAQWFARGGGHLNWYMWCGGNNFARMQGASTRPEYYTGSQVNPDGVSNEPFRSHTAAFNAAMASISGGLLNYPAQVHQQVNVSFVPANSPNGAWETTGQQYAFLYGSDISAPGAVAFVENVGATGVVNFQGRNYTSNGNSILIIGAGGVLVFDTSDISQGITPTRVWGPIVNASFQWSAWTEPAQPWTTGSTTPPAPGASTVGTVYTSQKPLEQLNLTQDDTEHLYYATNVSIALLRRAVGAAEAVGASSLPLLISGARSSALSAYFLGAVESTFASAYEKSESSGSSAFTINLPLPPVAFLDACESSAGGVATLIIFSQSLGIDKFSSINNQGDTFSTSAIKGITGAVSLGGVDITSAGWTQLTGLVGEAGQRVWTAAGSSAISWSPVPPNTIVGTPLTWYRTTFVSPPLSQLIRSPGGADVNASLQLDGTGLSRGHVYVNDWEISIIFPSAQCGSDQCQRYYYIPPDILAAPPALNNLTVIDVEGASNLTAVRLVLSAVVPPPACAAPPSAGYYNLSLSSCRGAAGAAGQTFSFTPANNGIKGAGIISLVANPSLCWTVGASNPITSTPVVSLASCISGGAPSQIFTFPVSTGNIVSNLTGTCLDVPNQIDYGQDLDLWGCNSGSNQGWTFASGAIISSLDGSCAGACA